MNKLLLSIALSFTILTISACAPLNGTDTPGLEGYYYAEFSDVPIPNEMAENKSETYITYVAGGVKSGQQVFEGRVEKNSLLAAMEQYMLQDGWLPRAASHSGNKSVLTYEKELRIATLLISEGTIFCSMQVTIGSRLSDADAVHINRAAYGSSGSGAATSSYPASGVSNSGTLQEKRLAQ